MKLLYTLLFALFCLLISCDFIEDPTKKERNPEENIPPLVKDLDLKELKKRGSSQKCSEYKTSSSFNIFGDASLLEPIKNCMAQSIDQGLKPLCDQEKTLKKELKNENDPNRQAEIKEQLFDIENIKQDITNDLYLLATEFDEIAEVASNKIEDRRTNNPLTNLLNTVGNVYVKQEFRGFTRFLDSKVNNACSGLNTRRN